MDQDYFAGYEDGIADVVKEATAASRLKKVSQFGGGGMGRIHGMRRRAVGMRRRPSMSRIPGSLGVRTPPTIL